MQGGGVLEVCVVVVKNIRILENLFLGLLFELVHVLVELVMLGCEVLG